MPCFRRDVRWRASLRFIPDGRFQRPSRSVMPPSAALNVHVLVLRHCVTTWSLVFLVFELPDRWSGDWPKASPRPSTAFQQAGSDRPHGQGRYGGCPGILSRIKQQVHREVGHSSMLQIVRNMRDNMEILELPGGGTHQPSSETRHSGRAQVDEVEDDLISFCDPFHRAGPGGFD